MSRRRLKSDDRMGKDAAPVPLSAHLPDERKPNHLPKGISRREILGAGIAAGAALSAGGLAGWYYVASRDNPVKDLEKFALKTHGGHRLRMNDGEKTNQLSDYELFFSLCFGEGFNLKQALEVQRKVFPGEKTLIIADVGGADGSAAADLDSISGVRAFVIDPDPSIPTKEWGLSRNRFIVRKIEETGLPDDTFHFLVSFDTLHFTNVPVAFSEIYRLLKPGGVALTDYHFWHRPEGLSNLKAVPIKENVKVVLPNATLLGQNVISLPVFLKAIDIEREHLGEDFEKHFAMIDPTFVISKPLEDGVKK